MAGNGSGNNPPAFEVFDALPPQIRRALRYAPRPYAPAMVKDRFIASRLTPDEYAARMMLVFRKNCPDWTPPKELTRHDEDAK